MGRKTVSLARCVSIECAEPGLDVGVAGKDGIAPLTTTKKGPSFKSKREDVARTHWVYTTFDNQARYDDEIALRV